MDTIYRFGKALLKHFQAPLPLWLKLYFFFLPFWGLNYKGIIFADLFLLFGMSASLLRFVKFPSSYEKPDALLLGILGISLLGLNIGLFPKFFAKEIAGFLFLSLGARTISQEIKTPQQVVHAVGLFCAFFLPILLVLSLSYLGETFFSLQFPFRNEARKFCWPFGFSGQLGIYLVFAYPLMMIQGIHWPWALRGFFYAILFLVASGVGSRSCLITIGLEMVCLEFFLLKTRTMLFPLRWRLITLLVCLFLLALPLSQDWTFLRAAGLSEAAGPLYYDSFRFNQISKIFENPTEWLLFGTGLGCFRGQEHVEIHNTFLSLWVELGMVGFALWLAWFYFSFKPLWFFLHSKRRKEQQIGRFIFLAITGLVIVGLVVNLTRSRFLWLLAGMLSGVRKKNFRPQGRQIEKNNPRTAGNKSFTPQEERTGRTTLLES